MLSIILHFGEDNFTIMVNIAPNEVPKILSQLRYKIRARK